MSKFSTSNTFVRKLEAYGSLTELDKTLSQPPRVK
jgi:hypothetical protein